MIRFSVGHFLYSLFIVFPLFGVLSCASPEKRGFDDGVLVSTVRTYELLVLENYELLMIMDDEGDTGPSRHRNLVVGRLNSALYHLGAAIKMMEGRKKWPESVLTEASHEKDREERKMFMRELENRWLREWKESFDDEAIYPFRELALETYKKYGNAFGIGD